jgi:hypothetical protein
MTLKTPRSGRTVPNVATATAHCYHLAVQAFQLLTVEPQDWSGRSRQRR